MCCFVLSCCNNLWRSPSFELPLCQRSGMLSILHLRSPRVPRGEVCSHLSCLVWFLWARSDSMSTCLFLFGSSSVFISTFFLLLLLFRQTWSFQYSGSIFDFVQRALNSRKLYFFFCSYNMILSHCCWCIGAVEVFYSAIAFIGLFKLIRCEVLFVSTARSPWGFISSLCTNLSGK